MAPLALSSLDGDRDHDRHFHDHHHHHVVRGDQAVRAPPRPGLPRVPVRGEPRETAKGRTNTPRTPPGPCLYGGEYCKEHVGDEGERDVT